MAYTKSAAGKGDDNRTKEWQKYWQNYDNIFKKPQQKPETVDKSNK